MCCENCIGFYSLGASYWHVNIVQIVAAFGVAFNVVKTVLAFTL
jgi:hypothetical protein